MAFFDLIGFDPYPRLLSVTLIFQNPKSKKRHPSPCRPALNPHDSEVGLSKTLKPMSGFTSRTTCSEDAPSLVLGAGSNTTYGTYLVRNLRNCMQSLHVLVRQRCSFLIKTIADPVHIYVHKSQIYIKWQERHRFPPLFSSSRTRSWGGG